MKRTHKHTKNASTLHESPADRIKRRDRRMLIRGVIALAVVIPLAAIGIYQYERKASTRLDLTVIGNGRPTVIEVCDYSRSSQPQCRQLRENVAAVEREFGDSIQFRTADLRTSDGAVFAVRHNVEPASVLLFGADGRLRERLAGPPERDALRTAIATNFPGSRSQR